MKTKRQQHCSALASSHWTGILLYCHQAARNDLYSGKGNQERHQKRRIQGKAAPFDTTNGMSSDPVDSDVVPANGNGSAKRPLDSDCKKADDLPDNQSSMESTTDAELDVENPPKRVKVEEVEAVEENPLNPVVSNDSSSTEAPPTQTTIVKDEKENGNTGANDESNSIAPTDVGTTSDTGIDADDSQTGRTSQPFNVFSPALTRSRAYSKEKTDNEGMESVKEEAAGASASTEKPSGRWRGKTN